MYRKQMVKFISNILTDLMSGKDFQENVNPVCLVSKIDSCELKYLPVEELEQKKNDCIDLDTLFWNGKEVMPSYDLLLEILHHMSLCESDINLMSDIITHGISNKEPGLLKLSPEEVAMQAKAVEAMPEDLPFDMVLDEDDDLVWDEDDENVCKPDIPSPQDIYDYIDKHIYKQSEAKRTAAMIYWEHLKGIHTNSVFLGPAGSGKSEIFRQMQSMSGDVFFFDATQLTQEGWKGSLKIRDVLQQVTPAVMQDGGAVIVLDEFDKMCERKMAGSENVAYSLQSELLKVIEGEMVQFKDFALDTSKISFVFLGSFASMVSAKKHIHNSLGFGQDINKSEVSYLNTFSQEDLIRYGGVRREIASRISRIVQLKPMREEDFYTILNINSMSPITELQMKFGTILEVDDKVKRQISKEAAESGLGVRYLKSRLLSMLEMQMVIEPDLDEYEITG